MIETHSMKNRLLVIACLFGFAGGVMAQEQGTDKAVPAPSANSMNQDGATTAFFEEPQVRAKGNTACLTTRYGITGEEQKQQIYDAYLKYFESMKKATAKNREGNRKVAAVSEMERALTLLEEELQQITGQETSASIPR